ncbi:winged helix-turn-helix transcriptional regulator [Patescibacteria group bacterium]|nr:winged helix-turn-helix transcriptional regulator [Patescibacteria group bacterium]
MRQISSEPHKIFFETLGNKTRWDIVHLLQKKACRATEIAEILGYEQSRISHNLRRLETCGFVRFQQKGSERIYELNEETIGPLLKLMDKHVNKYCKHLCKKK